MKSPEGRYRAPRPTLKTIAELSGLAVPTVSRALSDAPDIGHATKLKIREIAREIGYRPNRAGLRLRTGKTNVIALVIATNHDMMNHTARLISAIAAATRGTSYHMNVTPYFPDEDPMDPIRYVVETRSADGVILNQTLPNDPRIEYLLEQDFPFVTHGRTNWSDKHPYYDFDNGAFGRICVERLMAAGRRKLLLIAPRDDQFYSIEMIKGTKEACRAAGISITLLEGATSDDESPQVEAALHRLSASGVEIDGVISASTNAAMAATVAYENIGKTLGVDMDVIAKEALPFLKRFRKEIMVVQEDITRAGTFACEALMQAIDHPELPARQFLEVPSA